MTDFHCHIDLYPDPVSVAEECRRRGVSVLSVTTTPRAWHGTRALGGRVDGIRTALGLHPQLAQERRAELSLFDRLLGEAGYVGEVGLDGSPECRRFWDDQLAVFSHILDSCQRAGGRIMSIHSRRAAGDVLDCLADHPSAGVPILHWFSGSVAELRRATQQGCWFSVGPAMLAGARGRNLVAHMPHARVVGETDGPFAQVGGRAILPWEVGGIVGALADAWKVNADEVQDILARNIEHLWV